MTESGISLIGLTGGKGAGKDTLAQVLIDRGYENLKFAGALKEMIATLLAYQGADEAIIERMIEGDLKEIPSELLAGRTPRWAMQSLGTEWGRDQMGTELWVDATMNRAAVLPNTIITDVRFPNECDAVKKAGGRVYRIASVGGVAPSDIHESETHIAGLPVDGEFANDKAGGVGRAREAFKRFLMGK